MRTDDQLLEELQAVLSENGAIPQKTTNRLILAALRETYHMVARNTDELASLRIKSSMWGAVAGLMTTLGTIVLSVLLKIL